LAITLSKIALPPTPAAVAAGAATGAAAARAGRAISTDQADRKKYPIGVSSYSLSHPLVAALMPVVLSVALKDVKLFVEN
jgi:ABC-type sugar transport system substrate-binding protein